MGIPMALGVAMGTIWLLPYHCIHIPYRIRLEGHGVHHPIRPNHEVEAGNY